MLRIFLHNIRHRRYPSYLRQRRFSSSTPPSSCQSSTPSSNSHPHNPNHSPIKYVNSASTLSPLSAPTTASSVSRTTLSLSLLSILAVTGTTFLFYSEGGGDDIRKITSAIEAAVHRSTDSTHRIINQMKHTGAAAAVLWQSLQSVLSSANYEVRSGFEFRVAAFLADIAAANAARRSAIVAAGGGRVVDWLLETVAGDVSGTQAEAARALAYLIADPLVRPQVFGRPHSVPYLLRFISSSQPQRSKKNSRVSDSVKGRSMLVAAIMDVVTSTCDSKGNVRFQQCLPANAEMRDIASAIQVIEGGFLDDPNTEEDDDGGNGLKGIGIKVLGGTTVLGLSRSNGHMSYDDSDSVTTSKYASKNHVYQKRHDSYLGDASLSSSVVPGLWDDLHTQHVAVPFAAWALANWAMASEVNRFHIQELDQDGNAIMTALAAPERSVKWHGSLVAQLLLEDNNVLLSNSVSDWSSCLLSTISQACKTDDIPLALVALSAFLLSVDKSSGAKKVVMEKGLDLMRDTAKQTMHHKDIQEALARALELICTSENRLSVEESLKWSGILLPWACGKFSSEKTRYSATKILSCILEDFGPSSIPISQGWLTILINEVLDSTKASSVKGSSQPKSDKVKTQIDQSNIQSGILIASQLANSVVNLAGKQLGIATDRGDSFPIADLLSQEPFAGAFKSLNKDRNPKCDAADSAVATLKGIKVLTEICADDLVNQNKIVDSGVLCLLRRFLLRDDYESLAAIEAYDASRAGEGPDQASKVQDESKVDTNGQSNVRIPPSTHIRRHAGRLLTVLSALPKVQKVIIADATWCNWLEECANGKIPGCDDPKIQSYARATLLNVLCHEKRDSDTGRSGGTGTGFVNDRAVTRVQPRYEDMIYLINPESQHWKCHDRPVSQNSNEHSGGDNDINLSRSTEGYENCSDLENPAVDIVFVHGLRGGPFKSWRISEDKSSTKSGLVEKIDQEAGKQGTFWPGEWLSADFPHARLFTLRYKTNLTQWSGASLPLQEVSSMLLEKLVAADIGSRPIVFVTHSMGGLVVKQLLYQAKTENLDNLVNNTVGVVFYSCPHFGSKLADMPWRMGLVLRPAPTIGELRSGSPKLVELNDFMRQLHKKGLLEVLSFCETKVTPIVEGYGGWAFRMEIVPIESAYPGFGDIVVLESTDHINSCKPLSRDDPSYTEILEFLRKVKAQHT
ncbi:uncharacterized protein LOC110732042 [Chenopodium quinoa]|nr:uncharacterized protein LOC110732042 [Chenopodium quinoa]